MAQCLEQVICPCVPEVGQTSQAAQAGFTCTCVLTELAMKQAAWARS